MTILGNAPLPYNEFVVGDEELVAFFLTIIF